MSDIETETIPINDKNCWDRILLRASSDLAFRERLLAEPNKTLLSHGIKVAAEVKITVHEFDLNHQHIFLPPLGCSIAKTPVVKAHKGGNNG